MSTMSAGTGGGGGPPSSIMEGKIPVFVFPVQLGTRIHSVLDGTYVPAPTGTCSSGHFC